MKIIFSQETKLFTLVTHYTDSKGAKGILKYGFRKGDKRVIGPSFFEAPDDEVRNDENYNFNTILNNFYRRGLTNDEGKHDRRNGKFDTSTHRKWHRKYFLPESELGYLKTKNQYKTDSDLDESEHTKLLQSLTEKLPEGRTKLPRGYIQAAHIAQIAHNGDQLNPDTRTPIYRILAETKNDDDLYTPTGLIETRVPESNIDNSTLKVEIPRGMYTGSKRLKRDYINDFNDFHDSDYNTEDAPTNEALTDIMRKWQFLNSSHGKKRNKVN